ncbi:MAG: hypothetical protein QOD83_519 [Solirubrobacteraceae bacterium]|jgi:hypothetical protein|nr:hypothetical protein [Solirubrobacteraceae bacterium]MEA2181780.1 hypothetical protein [Solirubrobacteraceae bacterium]MEA2230703.1 hypothetical protein [Solirubrobacteraceae bacterium]
MIIALVALPDPGDYLVCFALLVLLAQRELERARGGPDKSPPWTGLDRAIPLLCLAFAVIVGLRIASLL